MPIFKLTFDGEDPIPPEVVKQAIQGTNFKLVGESSPDSLRVKFNLYKGNITFTEQAMTLEVKRSVFAVVFAAGVAAVGIFCFFGFILDYLNDYVSPALIFYGVVFLIAAYSSYVGFNHYIPKQHFMKLVSLIMEERGVS